MIRLLACTFFAALLTGVMALPAAAQSAPTPVATRNFRNTPRNTNIPPTPHPSSAPSKKHAPKHAPTKHAPTKHAAALHGRSYRGNPYQTQPVIMVDPDYVNRALASPSPQKTAKPTNTIKASGPDVFERYDTGAPP